MKKLTITNISAALLAVVTILLSFNIINSEQSITLTTAIPVIVTAVASIILILYSNN